MKAIFVKLCQKGHDVVKRGTMSWQPFGALVADPKLREKTNASKNIKK